MPNRIIKESICRSDSIDSLSWFEEVLFYRLIVVCDDYGRFDGRPAIIRGACFPLKDIRLEQIENALRNLSTAGMIWMYKAEERAFLQLINWERHQQIRATKSKYPAPESNYNHLKSIDINCNQMISDESNCSRNRERNRNRNRTREECAREVKPAGRFEEFWEKYPNRLRRSLAEKAYCDLLLSGKVTEEELVLAAGNYAEYVRTTGDKMYLPNNWLGKHAFEDYLPGKYQESEQKRASKDNPEESTEEEEELVGDDWMNCNNQLWEGNVWES